VDGRGFAVGSMPQVPPSAEVLHLSPQELRPAPASRAACSGGQQQQRRQLARVLRPELLLSSRGHRGSRSARLGRIAREARPVLMAALAVPNIALLVAAFLTWRGGRKDFSDGDAMQAQWASYASRPTARALALGAGAARVGFVALRAKLAKDPTKKSELHTRAGKQAVKELMSSSSSFVPEARADRVLPTGLRLRAETALRALADGRTRLASGLDSVDLLRGQLDEAGTRWDLDLREVQESTVEHTAMYARNPEVLGGMLHLVFCLDLVNQWLEQRDSEAEELREQLAALRGAGGAAPASLTAVAPQLEPLLAAMPAGEDRLAQRSDAPHALPAFPLTLPPTAPA
ncbi:unnamed protein product, partial [Polarella glacialis]